MSNAKVLMNGDVIVSYKHLQTLYEQRAELLEALKLLLEDADSTCETYYIAKAAITNAEATK